MVVADPGGLPADGLRERLRQADAVRRQHRRRGAAGSRERGACRGAAEDEPRRPAKAKSSADRSAMRYRKQRRGGKGVRDIRTSERNGPVVGVVSVRDGDDIMLITAQGMVNRTHVGRDPRRRPQHPGRPHHEPQRGRQDRLDRQGRPGGQSSRRRRCAKPTRDASSRTPPSHLPPATDNRRIPDVAVEEKYSCAFCSPAVTAASAAGSSATCWNAATRSGSTTSRKTPAGCG